MIFKCFLPLFSLLIIQCGSVPPKQDSEAGSSDSTFNSASLIWLTSESKDGIEVGYVFNPTTPKSDEQKTNSLKLTFKDRGNTIKPSQITDLKITPKMKCCGFSPKQDYKTKIEGNSITVNPLYFHAEGEWELKISFQYANKARTLLFETKVK